MAFPQTPLDVRTELQIGGTWTDVSADVLLRDPITISRGRADEASRPDPCKATVTFNNRNGKYSPRNPVGSNYGLIGRNTPVRISLPAAARYLRLTGDPAARASTPDATALDITGDIDIRVDATLTNWDTGADFVDLVGKWQAVGSYSWRLSLDTLGRPYLVWSTDGTTLFNNFPDDLLPVPSSGRISFRVTLDVDNGAGGNTANFYYSLTPGTSGPWTLFGSFPTPGVTSIFNSASPLDVGDITGTASGIPPVGKIHAVEIRSGIGGTVVANPVFSTPAAGASSFADSAGRTWTMSGGAEISDRDYRLHAEVSNWPPKWDVSGNDRYVPVEAAGQLRRYGAGTTPLQSTLRRRIPSEPTILAYWPMEDGSASTQAASGLSGGTPATLTGVTWAADDTLPGSAALPATGTNSVLTASVPSPAGSPTGWHVEFVYRIDTGPATQAAVLNIKVGGGLFREVQISLLGSTFTLTLVYADGRPDDVSTIPAPTSIGTWNRLAFYASQAGTAMTLHFQVITIGGDTYTFDSTSVTGTIGRVTALYGTYGDAIQGMRLGHLGVFATATTSIFQAADTGFDGEQAHARIDRLCKELGMPVAFPAGTGPTAAMGPQRPAPILDLLAECADADMGVLHEAREVGRLVYRRRRSFYNQAVRLALDYAVDGHVAPPLEPVDDDQAARNDITVTRANGSSAHLVQASGPLSILLPPAGIGPVPGGGTFNVQSDGQLPDMAGWLRHLGSWDDARYPSVHVDLAAGPGLIEAAKAVEVGDRMTIAHPPPECGGAGDTLDLLVQGYTETIGILDWDITYNCTPAAPWTVALLNDPVRARLQASGNTLGSGVNTTATSLQFATAAGHRRWIDSAAFPAMFPFSVRVAGEVMTVTAITGTSSPQTATVVRSVNGVVKSQSAGAVVRVATPMILAL